ncbi:hypothetical protein HDU96_006312 [Phlyctochytrium bullatum]|nr:hypothetical protein HDU96_006312 [Phlyctochytrium bullatum]
MTTGDPQAIDEDDPRYLSVKESFNSPSSRIFLDLPVLPRIATQHPHPHPKPHDRGSASEQRTTRRVAVAVSGDPSGTPMFMVVGMGGSRFMAWAYHDLGLKYRIKVIVIDRPGMGLSEPWDLATSTAKTSPTKHISTQWRGSFLDGAELLIQVADALGVDRFALMGMSCGCVYSLALALRHPHRLLPVPLQLFSCWVPPSVPECSAVVKSAFVLPTAAIVCVFASVRALDMDPKYDRAMRKLLGFTSRITEFSTSSGALLSNASGTLTHERKSTDHECTDEETDTPRRKDPGLVLLNRIVAKLNAITYVLSRYPWMSPEDAEEEVLRLVTKPKREPRGARRLSRSDDRRRRSSSGLSTPRLPVSTLERPSTALSDRGNNAEQGRSSLTGPPFGLSMTRSRTVSPAPPSGRQTPRFLDLFAADANRPENRPSSAPPRVSFSEPPRVSVSEPRASISALPNPPDTPNAPPWALVDVSAELPHLQPMPYTCIGSIGDFLHSIERTGKIGFAFEDIKHPVSARHGAKDTLVPLSSLRKVAKRCGWSLEVYDDEMHDMRKRTTEDGFREVRDAMDALDALEVLEALKDVGVGSEGLAELCA